MSRFSLRHVALAVALCTPVLALFLSAGPVGAQTPCLITGPSSSCKASQLCGPGPSELYSYHWTGPNGFESFLPCIIAEQTGTYTLVVTSHATGVPSKPCSHFFERTEGGIACEITGNRPICPGETVELCGPTAGSSWAWTGPGGFTSASRCITVGTTGVYELTVTAASGCASVCREEVALRSDCGGPGTGFDCPRTPGFWSQQCAQRDGGSTKYSVGAMTSITGCIDDMSDLFNWGDSDFSRFCANIDPPRPMDQRKQARRQFASFLANVCAENLGLITGNGERVGLDPTTEVICGGRETTIGDLIEDVDDLLMSLQSADLTLTRVKAAYGEIISCLDALNNGRGLVLDCDGDKPVLGNVQTESVAPMGEVDLYRAYPNPFSSNTRLAYAVSGAGENVRIGVYDLAGRLLKPLATGFIGGGRHEVSWDGSDASGTRVKPGIYFIRGSIGAYRIGTQVLYLK
jgi:hypothetical protein